ncbi:polyprenyl synthetase family protein [Kitasatospora sp. McL0602]|uniref:polyprenyl synthetase family protein n=1 Tax=Kitasatospora sp. McL0602 TaxID=3439530 RepID=UPI003F8B0862
MRSAVAPADRVAGLLAGAGEVVTGEAARWLSGMEPEDERIIGYQLGLWDADGRPGAGGGGKWVRAALTLSCARAAGGDPREALRGAGAVELLHTLSLLYDDAMDRDAVRRARPSAWRVFGRRPAERAAAALLPYVVARLFDPPVGLAVAGAAAAALGEAVVRLALGQAMDLDFERRPRVSVEECRLMIADKTASLMACACGLGALLAGADRGRTAGFTQLGEDLGMAFQIVDDILGLWGDAAVTGKPAGSDLRARKKSFPVAVALAADSPDSARLAAAYAHPADSLGPSDTAELLTLIEQLGGRKAALAEADAYLASAVRFLDEVRCTAGPAVRAACDDLAALAGYLAVRTR